MAEYKIENIGSEAEAASIIESAINRGGGFGGNFEYRPNADGKGGEIYAASGGVSRGGVEVSENNGTYTATINTEDSTLVPRLDTFTRLRETETAAANGVPAATVADVTGAGGSPAPVAGVTDPADTFADEAAMLRFLGGSKDNGTLPEPLQMYFKADAHWNGEIDIRRNGQGIARVLTEAVPLHLEYYDANITDEEKSALRSAVAIANERAIEPSPAELMKIVTQEYPNDKDNNDKAVDFIRSHSGRIRLRGRNFSVSERVKVNDDVTSYTVQFSGRYKGLPEATLLVPAKPDIPGTMIEVSSKDAERDKAAESVRTLVDEIKLTVSREAERAPASPPPPDSPAATATLTPPDGPPPPPGAALAISPVLLIDGSSPDPQSLKSLIDALKENKYYVVEPDGQDPAEGVKRGEYRIYDRSPRGRGDSTHLATLIVEDITTGRGRRSKTETQAKMTYFDGPADDEAARDTIRGQVKDISEIVDRTSAAVGHNPPSRPPEVHQGDIEPAEPTRGGRTLINNNVTRAALNMLLDAKAGKLTLDAKYSDIDPATLTIVPMQAETRTTRIRQREVEDKSVRTQIRQGDKILAVITGNPNDAGSEYEPKTRYADGKVAEALEKLFDDENNRQRNERDKVDPPKVEPVLKGENPDDRNITAAFLNVFEKFPYDSYEVSHRPEQPAGRRKTTPGVWVVEDKRTHDIVVTITDEEAPVAHYLNDSTAKVFETMIRDENAAQRLKRQGKPPQSEPSFEGLVPVTLEAAHAFMHDLQQPPLNTYCTLYPRQEEKVKKGNVVVPGIWEIQDKSGKILAIVNTGYNGELPKVRYRDQATADALKPAMEKANHENQPPLPPVSPREFEKEPRVYPPGVVVQLLHNLPPGYKHTEEEVVQHGKKRNDRHTEQQVINTDPAAKEKVAAVIVRAEGKIPSIYYYDDDGALKGAMDKAKTDWEAAHPQAAQQYAEAAAGMAAGEQGKTSLLRRSGQKFKEMREQKQQQREQEERDRQRQRDEPMSDKRLAATLGVTGAIGAATAAVLAKRSQEQEDAKTPLGQQPRKRGIAFKVGAIISVGVALLGIGDALFNEGKITKKTFNR